MTIRARQILLFLLCGAFVLQTWLVYSDPTGTQHALSPTALEGQQIWREHNCQSCHQLYGYGGFLGPDLTNNIQSLSRERMASILSVGLGQMPAFNLNAKQQHELTVFLSELDRTGISQPKLGEVLAPAEFLFQISQNDESLSPSAARGACIVRAQNCLSCHLPNRASLHQAGDMTLLGESLSRAEVQTILRDGIKGQAMPRLFLSDQDGSDVWDYLLWMQTRGAELRERFKTRATSRELDLSRLPWFEYQ